MLQDPHPAFEIIVLQLRRGKSVRGGTDDVARFKHEGLGVVDLVRYAGVGRTCFFERWRVRAMADPAVVQAGAAGPESEGFGVILAINQYVNFQCKSTISR